MGMCSCAWNRIAVSSSLWSSICGNRRVRTATRWLATPARTFLESLPLEKSSLSERPSASGSETSPSRKTPDSSGSVANLPTAEWPFDATSAAAMLPASMSRPTTALVFFAESIPTQVHAHACATCLKSALQRDPLSVGSAPGPRAALAAEERGQVPVDDRVAVPEANYPAQCQKWPERHRLLTRRDPATGDQNYADQGASGEADQDRRCDGAAEI